MRSAFSRNRGPSRRTVSTRGSPRSSGTCGSPRSRSGGTNDMRSRCSTMCALRSASAKPSIGEPMASQSVARPRRKCRQARLRETARAGLADGEPAAGVDDGGEKHHRGEEDRRRPIVEDGLEFRRHWMTSDDVLRFARRWRPGGDGGDCSLVRTICREASMAGVRSPPRRVSRKCTSAVVSEGLSALP